MNYFLRLIAMSLICLNPMISATDDAFQCKVPVKQVKKDKTQAKTQKHAVEDDKDNSPLLDIVKDIAMAYCIMMFSNYIHEVGHGLSHAILYQRGYFIHIGQPNNKPWLHIPGFAINSLNPFEGAVTMSDRSGIKTSAWKDVSVSAAGPLVGAAWTAWQYISLHKKYPCKYPISKFVSLVWIGVNLANFVPYICSNGTGSDGMLIYQALKN